MLDEQGIEMNPRTISYGLGSATGTFSTLAVWAYSLDDKTWVAFIGVAIVAFFADYLVANKR